MYIQTYIYIGDNYSNGKHINYVKVHNRKYGFVCVSNVENKGKLLPKS